MTLYGDIQKLEPGAEVILFQLDPSDIGGGGAQNFHGYTQQGVIYFQGEEYFPWPITVSGLGRTGERPPTPSLTVANLDGSIAALCMLYQDLVGAKLTIKKTFGKYLDAANFGGVNPTADPDQEFPPEVWYIERKANEDYESVTFELSSVMNFAGVELPRREIIANFCPWVVTGGYRGPYCGYTGPAVATVLDVPTASMAEDSCSGTLKGCKFRFGEHGALPTGAMPAAGLVRG